MIKYVITHKNLRRSFEEIQYHIDELDDEAIDRFIRELKYSLLIVAADISPDRLNFMTVQLEGKSYGLLFTDIQEFEKTFGTDVIGSQALDFNKYKEFVRAGLLDGYIINPESEAFICRGDLVMAVTDLPDMTSSDDGAYSSTELRNLKDSIDNRSLEEFLGNPSNVGKYEELFERMSSSTLLTLMVSREDLASHADDGMISLDEVGPMGFLYLEEVGGKYATVYTSEERIADVKTGYNKYSQIVNFCQLARYSLNDDMDGIIINPNSDNVLLTRDVLLEYSDLLERTCNNSKLNNAIDHMFLIEEEV